MREIGKYRGKILYNGKHLFSGDWIEGNLVIKSDETVWIYYIEKDQYDNIIREELIQVIPETVGEYTGLNNIYEGDKFRHPSGEIGVVIYVKEGCQFRLQYKDGNTGHIGMQIGKKGQAVKIGTIHDKEQENIVVEDARELLI